ncbi:MAG: serine/threonine-protein kinase [Myxococcales bacterium]
MADSDPKQAAPVGSTLPSGSGAPTEKLGGAELDEDTVKRRNRPGFEGIQRGATVGRYLVVDLLGEGGMGSIYRAFDPELGRQVAIKLLKPSAETLDDARGRLLREAQAMARLSHPNVVPVYDAGTHGWRLFVAMELVEGKTLAKWLETPRGLRETLNAFAAAGEGLRAAHAAGIVHRDFKPENVLIGDDGRVRVTDFGLAHSDVRHEASTEVSVHAPPQATLTGTISGTPAYMAPEQMLGEATDARTDQFSFCVALWEALTGHPPFGRGDFGAMRESVLAGKPSAPQRPLPKRLHKALLKGMSRRREERYPSMDDLLIELRRDPARRLRQAALPALSLAVLAGLGLFFGWRAREEQLFCARETSARLEQLWGSARREGLAQRLATVTAFPANEVIKEIDGNLLRWSQMRLQTCEGARIGDPSAALQRDCLDRYAIEADVLVGALGRPAEELADIGVGLVDSLGGPEQCGGLQKKTFAMLRPDADLMRWQSEARMLIDLGKASEALALARPLAPQARAQGALDTASGFEELCGRAMLQVGEPTEEALAHFRQAVRDADASGSDYDGFLTRLALTETLNLQYLRPKDALEVLLDTEAWLRRLGSPKLFRQRFVRNRAQILTNLGRPEEAVAFSRESAQLAQEIPVSLSDQGSALADLAAVLSRSGRYSEAATVLEQAIDLYGRARWKSANEQVVSLMNLGVIRAGQGRSAEALEVMDRARALAQTLKTLDQHQVWIDSHRGRVLVDLGRLDDAEPVLDGCAVQPVVDRLSYAASLAALARVHAARGQGTRALEAAEKATAMDPGTNKALTAYADFSLAQALRCAGKDPVRAQALARSALAGYAGPEEGFRRKQIDDWVAAAGSPSRKP